MIESNEVFTKVQTEDKKSTYKIKTEWENGYFRLHIFEGSNAWFALVTKDHIKMLADQHELEPVQYFNRIREYICSEQSSVSFNIVKKQFIIYRSIQNEKMRIKYFYANLETLHYQETLESIYDDLVDKYAAMQAKVKELNEQKLDSENQKFVYERKCEEFVELKNKSDLQMYSTFLLSLNEKKHRIRFLTELLDEYETGRKPKCNLSATTSNVSDFKEAKIQPATKSTSTPKRPKEMISDSESNDSDKYNTDEEKNEKRDEPIPGTSADNLDFLEDDSPPPPSLPKRIKRDKGKVSSDNSTPTNFKQKAEVNAEKVVNTQKENSDNESGSDDMQELLDAM